MKIVINTCFGGFSLSKEAYKFLGLEWIGKFGFAFFDERTNHKLIECVEQLGKAANGEYSDLKVVEIPDDIEYSIKEYDGKEHIAQSHTTWH
tara:strand:- start:1659 stop:1934 length:276 start_codon:yes stop_codon:yes gene_type:complete